MLSSSWECSCWSTFQTKIWTSCCTAEVMLHTRAEWQQVHKLFDPIMWRDYFFLRCHCRVIFYFYPVKPEPRENKGYTLLSVSSKSTPTCGTSASVCTMSWWVTGTAWFADWSAATGNRRIAFRCIRFSSNLIPTYEPQLLRPLCPNHLCPFLQRNNRKRAGVKTNRR